MTGLENYREAGATTDSGTAFWIGIKWAFLVTILQFLASLGLALLLNLDLRLRWLARTLALVPWAMPPVIIAIMWRLMLNPRQGPVNEIFGWFGLDQPINWLGDRDWAFKVAVVVGVWAGMPQTTITLARRAAIGVRRAARGRRDRRRVDVAPLLHVTLPALRPIIVAITTLDMISNFNSFALVYVLTDGGPGDDDAADAVRLQRGVPLRQLGLRGGDGQRDGRSSSGSSSSSTSGATGRRMRSDPHQHQPGDAAAAVPGAGAYMIFLGVPAAVPADDRVQDAPRRSATSICCPSGFEWQNFRDAIDETRTVDDGPQQRPGRDRHDAADDPDRAAGGLRPGPLQDEVRGVATGWILLSQVFPFILIIIPLFLLLRKLPIVDWNWVNTHQGLIARVHGVVAAVRAVDAARLHRRHPGRPGGGGGDGRRVPDADAAHA